MGGGIEYVRARAQGYIRFRVACIDVRIRVRVGSGACVPVP